MTWAEVAQVPLCLLTPDMQNRRIIDRLLQERRRRVAADAGIGFDDPAVLACAHRPLGERDAGEARRDAGLTDTLRAIPIAEPEAVQTIGLVVPAREPMMPNTAALVAEARAVAAIARPRIERGALAAADRRWRTIPPITTGKHSCTSPTPSA